MSTDPDAFDNAKFYTCLDVDRLTCTTPEEAIQEYLDHSYESGVSISELIDKLCPVTVEAWDQCEVSASEIEDLARSMIDHTMEWIAETYGGPDHEAELLETDRCLHVMPAMQAAVVRIVAHASWNGCEQVADWEYNADRVTEIVRDLNPEWFKTGEGGA